MYCNGLLRNKDINIYINGVRPIMRRRDSPTIPGADPGGEGGAPSARPP
jgi:hypothetical protein